MSNISFTIPRLDKLESAHDGALCLFVFEEKMPLAGVSGLVDWRLHGHLSSLIISGFITGEFKETLLFPPAGRLPQAHLLMFGLGARKHFNKQRFTDALYVMFNCLDKLKTRSLIMTLPGRPENQCKPEDAVHWFLEFLDQRKYANHITVIEQQEVHKTMLSMTERWSLKNMAAP